MSQLASRAVLAHTIRGSKINKNIFELIDPELFGDNNSIIISQPSSFWATSSLRGSAIRLEDVPDVLSSNRGPKLIEM